MPPAWSIHPRGGYARTETRRRVDAVARAVLDVSWLELDRRRPGRADGARKRRTTEGAMGTTDGHPSDREQSGDSPPRARLWSPESDCRAWWRRGPPAVSDAARWADTLRGRGTACVKGRLGKILHSAVALPRPFWPPCSSDQSTSDVAPTPASGTMLMVLLAHGATVILGRLMGCPHEDTQSTESLTQYQRPHRACRATRPTARHQRRLLTSRAPAKIDEISSGSGGVSY